MCILDRARQSGERRLEPPTGTAPVVQNTRTRPALEISSSADLIASISPGQPGRTAANTYDAASVPPVAGDDPVNKSDPKGDATV